MFRRLDPESEKKNREEEDVVVAPSFFASPLNLAILLHFILFSYFSHHIIIEE